MKKLVLFFAAAVAISFASCNSTATGEGETPANPESTEAPAGTEAQEAPATPEATETEVEATPEVVEAAPVEEVTAE